MPQGSILGPTLWCLAYTEVLVLEMPKGVDIIAYVDDLAVVITAITVEELEHKANTALERAPHWMKGNSLELTLEKFEAIPLIDRKKCRERQSL